MNLYPCNRYRDDPQRGNFPAAIISRVEASMQAELQRIDIALQAPDCRSCIGLL